MMDSDNIKWLIYGSLISADNTEYTEEEKQESMRRFELTKDDPDWEFILEPFEKEGDKNRLVDLFR